MMLFHDLIPADDPTGSLPSLWPDNKDQRWRWCSPVILLFLPTRWDHTCKGSRWFCHFVAHTVQNMLDSIWTTCVQNRETVHQHLDVLYKSMYSLQHTGVNHVLTDAGLDQLFALEDERTQSPWTYNERLARETQVEADSTWQLGQQVRNTRIREVPETHLWHRECGLRCGDCILHHHPRQQRTEYIVVQWETCTTSHGDAIQNTDHRNLTIELRSRGIHHWLQFDYQGYIRSRRTRAPCSCPSPPSAACRSSSCLHHSKRTILSPNENNTYSITNTDLDNAVQSWVAFILFPILSSTR